MYIQQHVQLCTVNYLLQEEDGYRGDKSIMGMEMTKEVMLQ